MGKTIEIKQSVAPMLKLRQNNDIGETLSLLQGSKEIYVERNSLLELHAALSSLLGIDDENKRLREALISILDDVKHSEMRDRSLVEIANTASTALK